MCEKYMSRGYRSPCRAGDVPADFRHARSGRAVGALRYQSPNTEKAVSHERTATRPEHPPDP